MTTDYGSVTLWAIILAGGIGTFALRLSFIALFGRIDEVPEPVERALRFVPAAVLSALVLPDLLVVNGGVALPPENLRVVAGALAAVVAWYAEDMVTTIAAGMGALWLLHFLV